MTTIGDIEFEPEQTKALYFATQTIGLMAGDMTVHAHCAPIVLETIKQHSGPLLVRDIAEYYAKEFSIYRRYLAERRILAPLNLDCDTIHTHEMTAETRKALRSEMRKSALEALITIAGLDHTGAHIYVVADPGVAISFDTESFAVTGLGAELARPQLMLARYHRRWSPVDAAFLIYSAKRRAETVSSVGTQTDMFMVVSGQNPPIYQYQANDMKVMSKIFNRQLLREQKNSKQASKEFVKYLTGAQKPQQSTSTADQQPSAQQPSSEPTVN